MIIDRIEWETDGPRKLAVGGWRAELKLWPLKAYVVFPERRDSWGWMHPAIGFEFGYSPRHQQSGFQVYAWKNTWSFWGHLDRPWGHGRAYQWLHLSFTRSKQ